MISLFGEVYELHRSEWGGDFHAYLCNGVYTYRAPTHLAYQGYIITPDGVIAIYKSKVPWAWVLVTTVCFVALMLFVFRSPSTEYYPVSFAERPVYKDGTIYCTVVNVSEREVTVRFGDNAGNVSVLTLLRPGETIPTLEVDFTPAYIEYDQKYQFELEVQYD